MIFWNICDGSMRFYESYIYILGLKWARNAYGKP